MYIHTHTHTDTRTHTKHLIRKERREGFVGGEVFADSLSAVGGRS